MKTFTEWYNDQGFKHNELKDYGYEYQDMIVAYYIASLGHDDTCRALKLQIADNQLERIERNLGVKK